jgi:hypothetical protein
MHLRLIGQPSRLLPRPHQTDGHSWAQPATTSAKLLFLSSNAENGRVVSSGPPALGAADPTPFKQGHNGDQRFEWLWFLDSLRGYPLRLHVACVKGLALSDDLSKLVAIRQGNDRIANCKNISEVLKGIP